MDDASPRFRQDLEATPTEADGVACVDVRDPQSGTNFRFYDFEYQLALQFTGQPLPDVTAWASEAYGVDLTVEGINEFAGRLAELGFLETAAQTAASPDTTPAHGTSPPEAPESAEAEWMSAEGAKTATFVPDPGMLDSPADLTPVAPELPSLEAEAAASMANMASMTATAASDAATGGNATPPPEKAKPAEGPTPPPRLFDIPMPAAPVLPALKPAAPAASAKPASSWAMDLEGTLQPQGEQGQKADKGEARRPEAPVSPPAPGADDRTPPPVPRPFAGAVAAPGAVAPVGAAAPRPRPPVTAMPPGLPERRQPPTPEAVQMGAFSQETGAGKEKSRAGRIVAVIILLLAVAGIVYVAVSRENARVPQAVRVRVFSPKPAAIYRWFSGRGTVTDHEARTLAFDSSGTLAELLPPGTAFVAGDIIGRLRGAQPIEALLGRHRARLAFYQQMRDSMRAANNQGELRQAEIKLADKRRLVDDAVAGLAKLVVRASEPGEVVETFAKVGTPVKANAPLMRVKGRVLHGEFELDPDELHRAGTLGFCRVEVVGLGPRASNAEAPAAGSTAADVGSPEAQPVPRFVDCAITPSNSDGPRQKVRVALPDNLGLVPGQPLRLARQRYDAVFPVPAAAVSETGGRRAVWIISAARTAERREIGVADAGEDVLVSDGLRVGEEVILDAPADLQAGAAVIVER